MRSSPLGASEMSKLLWRKLPPKLRACRVPKVRGSPASTSNVLVSNAEREERPVAPRDSRFAASPFRMLVKNAMRRPPFCSARREVGQTRAAVDVEGADAGVDDALGAGHAAGERQPAAVGQLVVHARVELRLGGAGVGVGRIRRVERGWDRAGGPRQRVLGEVAGRELVGPLVVHRLRVRAVHVEQRAGVVVHAGRVAVEAADADGQRRCRRSAASSRGDLVMTLTTPLIALAPQTADAGPRITSICLISLALVGTRSHITMPKKSR